MLLNNQKITEEIKKEVKICIEINDNENMTIQNLLDSVKAVQRGKFITTQFYVKKEKKHQIKDITLHQKKGRTTKLVQGKKT